MQVPALYIPDPDDNASVALPCSIRVHTKFDALGGVRGTSFAYAETREEQPQIIAWRSQVPYPERGAIFSVAPGEAYRVDHSDEPYGDTITIYVLRIPESEVLPMMLLVPDLYEADYGAGLVDAVETKPDDTSQSYIQVALDAPAVPSQVLAGSAWQLPLSQNRVLLDRRSGAVNDFDYFEANRLRVPRQGYQMFVRFDLDIRSLAVSNTVRLTLDVGDPIVGVHILSQPIGPSPSGGVTNVSLLTRVFGEEAFRTNGGVVSVAFDQDAELVGARIYVSE